jgi:tRNA(Ile2) C34 agmatinyltransferase TiaS
MSTERVNGGQGPTLNEVLVELLAAVESRGPGRYPRCPVCGSPMAVVEPGGETGPVLRCDTCGARLEDAEADGVALRLVA